MTAIQLARQYAELISGVFEVRYVFLFGSFAKDTANEDSDIDIAVVADDFSGDKVDDTFRLMKFRREIDCRIEPHAFLTEEFSGDRPDPFAREILATGVRIA